MDDLLLICTQYR